MARLAPLCVPVPHGSNGLPNVLAVGETTGVTFHQGLYG
jgi:hypothetical protein